MNTLILVSEHEIEFTSLHRIAAILSVTIEISNPKRLNGTMIEEDR